MWETILRASCFVFFVFFFFPLQHLQLARKSRLSSVISGAFAFPGTTVPRALCL